MKLVILLLGFLVLSGCTTFLREPDNYLLTSGNGNLRAYGNFYSHDMDTVIDITDSNTWTPTNGHSSGFFKGLTFLDSNGYRVDINGLYKIDYGLSFSMSGGSNLEVEAAILVNGVFVQSSTSHRKIGTASDAGNTGGTTIIELDTNDFVELGVLNETGTQDVIIGHANVAMIRIDDLNGYSR